VDEAIYASTKNTAQSSISRLESLADHLATELEPYAYEKLCDLISFTKDASGQVRDKEHWMANVKQVMYKFERNFDFD
jgi:hypothetical protein